MVRLKHRYILVEILWKDWQNPSIHQLPVAEEDIYGSVRNAIQYLHGEFGVGVTRFHLTIKFFNPYTRVFLLRTRRGAHTLTLSALPFVTKIKDDAATLRVLKLAGTIRSCLKFLKKYDCAVMLDVLNRAVSAEAKRQAKEKIAEVYASMETTKGGIRPM
ncbi:ribonuclease P/MRP protein subunit POP5, putative [Ixodes scapularis]|uniref:Ribonuclease P/MRP protein subunit POP5 n=1 Tax=Ixodes scapularis TaxID=6945 RepID=B7PM44_IXOSC|nr:ribonuclease P/MRP protein subunit POP5, putative [Ixodes scapularis]|eukprot:XP_002434842.1 ribonuclease P/MRP protein subunit POP5, putative [Ixodes scapularis]